VKVESLSWRLDCLGEQKLPFAPDVPFDAGIEGRVKSLSCRTARAVLASCRTALVDRDADSGTAVDALMSTDITYINLDTPVTSDRIGETSKEIR